MNKKIEWIETTCPKCGLKLEVESDADYYECPKCKQKFEVRVLSDKEAILQEIEEIKQEDKTRIEILEKIFAFMVHSEQKRCVFILTKTEKGIIVEGSNEWFPLIEKATELLSEGIISHIIFEKLPNGKIDVRLAVLEKD